MTSVVAGDHGVFFRVRPPGSASWIRGFAITVSLLALLPLIFVGAIIYQTGWETSSALIFRPRVGELLINTVLLVLFTVPICTVLAVALAWLVERSNLPMARLWDWLAVTPLAIPAFVQSYAWVTIMPGFNGLLAGVTISVIAYFPFLYLPISAALRRLDPSLEDAASSLGLSPWKIFVRVVVPQLRWSICGGSLLVGLHLLGEYGLYVMIRFDTFTTAIVDQFQSSYNGPAANVLGIVLAIGCLLLTGGEGLLRGSARYARLGAGAPRLPSRTQLGRYAPLCMMLPVATALLSIGVPFLTIGRWLAAGGADVWRLDELVPTVIQTVALSLAGGVLTVLLAIPMGWISVRQPGRLQRLLESANYLSGALPGVVVALALVTITVRVALPLYQTLVTILLAYALMFLPRALIGLRTSLAQAPVQLEEAARGLGRSPRYALWAITLRLAAPGAAAGVALVALGILNELTATQMLAPNGTRTLAMAFWSLSGEIDYAGAAPYAVVMVAFSLPLTWVLYVQSKRIAGR